MIYHLRWNPNHRKTYLIMRASIRKSISAWSALNAGKVWIIKHRKMVQEHLEESNSYMWQLNTLKPKQNGRHFAANTFKHIFWNENIRILIKISLNFVPKGPINNTGDKPLSEPMMVRLPMHICITRPQWVNTLWPGDAIPDSNVSWTNVGPMSGREYRHWANIGPNLHCCLGYCMIINIGSGNNLYPVWC